ncbi:twin-arginine translocase TatA/TatE family subunit [Promicromonospora thailandica]|uniref:Sec-independent protein translocase protein TatB n=1 Tax=Promicromonospora thailandica TaxID=765201 RepID=A0A9X2JWD9_9MICO|nr:twin-arginine translocase TatA/TatE family subunit [Promicromonospora thailandica]MCP2263014.1 sec-independent protein translocase protein TatB [Promicromonospora thailandica]BFF18383.1 twin-arginine translocase TatA/TatE family subunit [Promicromonospora thailandica]
MFGINGWEFVIIIVVAMLVIGPERLPGYAEQLGSLVRRGRDLLQTAKARVDDELGPEFSDVDWSKLDPRQYDPRKIVRDALLDDSPAPYSRPASAGRNGTPAAPAEPGKAPYDDEAT